MRCAWRGSGAIRHRGEGFGLAVDGQAGCILRAYREHQMTADGAWLKQLWPNIKLAMQCLIKMDKGDGLLDGHQWNTLDAGWYGQIAWLSGLYLASLRAAACRRRGQIFLASHMPGNMDKTNIAVSICPVIRVAMAGAGQ